MTKDLFANPIFQLFLEEIHSLGFVVSSEPSPGTTPYAVIGGRSNPRWWLVPLASAKVTAGGLALFQPIVPSARLLKATASALSAVGLASLWAHKRVYVACPPVFSDIFDCGELSYAFFTGTDCPHRKTAIQIMSADGTIKGFAKLSLAPAIKQIIAQEANRIEYLHSLRLVSCRIPKVLLSEEISGAQILVTDTEKTRWSNSPTAFTKFHKDFLSELMAKTSRGSAPLTDSRFLFDLHRQTKNLAPRLPDRWTRRLVDAVARIDRLSPTVTADMAFCHGDFTPWNTFMATDRLYVFDWEYAQPSYPAGYDLIHFMLSLPATRRQPAETIIALVRKRLLAMGLAASNTEADVLFLCYLCGHSLQYIAREPWRQDTPVVDWPGAAAKAALIDAAIEQQTA